MAFVPTSHQTLCCCQPHPPPPIRAFFSSPLSGRGSYFSPSSVIRLKHGLCLRVYPPGTSNFFYFFSPAPLLLFSLEFFLQLIKTLLRSSFHASKERITSLLLLVSNRYSSCPTRILPYPLALLRNPPPTAYQSVPSPHSFTPPWFQTSEFGLTNFLLPDPLAPTFPFHTKTVRLGFPPPSFRHL